VFVVQLEGTKRWRVWEPTGQSRDPIGGKHAVARPTVDQLGAPMLDLLLEPGDVLYLPRGHPHVAETTDEASAHLTVGLLAITWHRVVRQAVDQEIAAGRLRASIPLSILEPQPGTGRDGSAGPQFDAGATPDLGAMPVDLGAVAMRRWIAREIWRRQAATRLRPREPVDPVACDRPLAVAPGPLITLSRSDGRSLLFVGDRTISMPDEAHGFLAAIVTGGECFCRADLPGLDETSSRVVVDRLLDEGVLVPAPGGSTR
jgi:hypothetical protein